MLNSLVLICITRLISCQPETFKSKSGEEIELSSVEGKDIFEVTQKHSEKAPETLEGTSIDTWIVYYSDINVTFETNKSTNEILSATLGKNPE